MKKKGFKLLALAVITACCFGISAASAFAADVETKTAMNGASIRATEPTGLRFEAVVDATTYESVDKDAGKSFGAFILPKDYLTAANINITAITNHKEQFAAVEKYLEKEGIEGGLKGSEYVLKYSIAQLHYYNYNREFVGMFFIKTVGADSAVSYQYFTVNAANNERSVAFVAKAAIENGSDVPDAAYDFAIAAKYLEANPCNSAEEEPTKKKEAEAFVNANKEGFKTAYTAIKAAADIEKINILEATQKPNIQAARKAYDEADAVIKDLLDDFGIYDKFIINEAAYQEAEAAGLIPAVNNAIDALPEYNVSTVPVVYNKNYKTAKDAYDKLTEEQKEQIKVYAKLKKYEDAAAKVMMIYEDSQDSLQDNTSYLSDFIFQIQEVTDSTPDLKGYGYISRVYCNGAAANVRLAFNNLPDLTDYDVVRFPIYLDPDKVGTSTWPLVYKFKDQDAILGGYRTLKAGWNIVTVPVSKVANGIEIGANMIAAKTNVYYAIPYAEKLESGDAIASYKYESNGVYIGGATSSFVDAYRADVTFSSTQDNDYGTVIYVKAEASSWNGGAKDNYAFKPANLSEIKSIVAETNGATAVRFRIKANKNSTICFTEDSNSHGEGIKTISLTTDWQEVEVTVAEFAKWNGYFRSQGCVPVQLWISDFTIVK